ncbi:MAG: hypothetical protein RLY70_4770 [Planctomycetota bacterium]
MAFTAGMGFEWFAKDLKKDRQDAPRRAANPGGCQRNAQRYLASALTNLKSSVRNGEAGRPSLFAKLGSAS